jgi:hypothetical protein
VSILVNENDEKINENLKFWNSVWI